MNIEEDILIERFLKNELTPNEKALFVKRLSTEKILSEKVAFEKQLFETLNEKDWSYAQNVDSIEKKEFETLFKSDQTKNIKKVISESYQVYLKKRARKTRNWLLYSTSVAAAVIFITLYTFSLSEISSDQLYNSYLKDTKPNSSFVRGNKNTQKTIAEAELLFEDKQYDKAIHLFSEALVSNTENSAIYIFLAISNMELNRHKEAESILNDLIASNLINAQKGYWYKSLLYLKSKDLIRCKKSLQVIIDNSYYNYVKAKELLDKLTDL